LLFSFPVSGLALLPVFPVNAINIALDKRLSNAFCKKKHIFSLFLNFFFRHKKNRAALKQPGCQREKGQSHGKIISRADG